MATDEYHETEEETLARHRLMLEGLSDPRRMNWAVWEAFIHESKCLTSEGKQVALWTVEILRQTLRDDFFRQIFVWMEDMQRNNPGTLIDPHPVFLLGYFPANDAPWVYANLLRLAISIQLFNQIRGQIRINSVLKHLRRQREPINWTSRLLQLEVAALGLKAGWDILFEPPFERGGHADVRLTKGSTRILVETTVMRFSNADRRIMLFSEQLMGQIGVIRLQYKVNIYGSLHCASLMNVSDLIKFFHDLEEAARATSQGGKSRQILEPSNTHVTIYHPSEKAKDDNLDIFMGLIGDHTFSRLRDILVDKNDQASKSNTPVWVCIDEYAGLLEVMRSHGMTYSQIRDYLSGFVRREIAVTPLPHLAGVIISSGLTFPDTISPDSSTLVTPSEDNGSTLISCYRLIQRVRHTFVIPRNMPSDDVEVFTELYAHEDEWLDWALGELKYSAFKDLVQW